MGAQDRFFLGTHRAFRKNEVAFTQSKKPSGVSVDVHLFYGYDQLLATLTLQPSHSHVTSLWLLLERDLLNPPDFGDVVHDARRQLVLALSVNECVRRLEVDGSWSGEAETRLLADTVHSSRTLCHVSLGPDKCQSAGSLVRKLSPKIAGNYTLLSIRSEDSFQCSDEWFRVNNVTRRNGPLVTRAAHFVTEQRKSTAQQLPN
ncbi:hypothetical protein MTO96_038800 [Rhipicephalus appendiculatus]